MAFPTGNQRLKARGLALYGGPPGGLEESDPAGCDFVRDGRSMPPALTDHTMNLPWSGADLLLNEMYTKHLRELLHARKAWPGTLVDPCLLSGMYCRLYMYVHCVCMYSLIRGSLRTYTKDLAKASCVHL
jgi:hypothetical protein